MTSYRIRAVLLFAASLLFATALAACEICDDDSHQGEGHTHVWCDFPPNNSWGYDECSMRSTPDGEICWTGVSMCYYTEREGGGGDPGGGGDGGGGDDEDCNRGGYCPAWCAVCNLEP